MSSRARDEHPHAQQARPEDPARALADHAAHAMILVGPDGRIRYANGRALALLELSEGHLIGRPVADIFPRSVRKELEACLLHVADANEGPEDIEIAGGPDATGPPLAVTFLPLRDAGLTALLVRDLTRQRSERDAHRKMVDLGRLIAGVSHEMRTPLTYVQNNVALARSRVAGDPVATRELDSALDGLQRLARVLQELRPLTKNRPHRAVRINLAELAVEAVRMFEATRTGTTRIELDLQATHLVAVDRDDMLGVITNLLVNASQAMGNRGVIRVRTRNRETPPEIRVIDHGPGVKPEERAHIFEPFFTTKPDGTGLGLFISRRAVEAHGGTLTCEETAGGGATFVVRLPTE